MMTPAWSDSPEKAVFISGIPSSCNRLILRFVQNLGADGLVAHCGPREGFDPQLMALSGRSLGEQIEKYPQLTRADICVLVPVRERGPWEKAMLRNYGRRLRSFQSAEIHAYFDAMVEHRNAEIERMGLRKMEFPIADLVRDPEAMGRRIAAFIGLEYKPWRDEIRDPDAKHGFPILEVTDGSPVLHR